MYMRRELFQLSCIEAAVDFACQEEKTAPPAKGTAGITQAIPADSRGQEKLLGPRHV